MSVEICTCGRPNYAEGDLTRWREATDSGTNGDPPWARAICWTTNGVKCNMKPLKTDGAK